MWGLAINIKSFAHLLRILRKVDFDALIDHLALTHIITSNAEQTTTRIKRLFKILSAYLFNLYYMKGKYVILSNFLSRQRTDNSNSYEIIPISFDMQVILRDMYYIIWQGKENRYLIQTCSQVKASGIKLPAVHGVDKGVDPSVKAEKQILKPIKLVTGPNPQVHSKPRLGQGRAGLRIKVKMQTQSSSVNPVKDRHYQNKQKWYSHHWLSHLQKDPCNIWQKLT